MAHKLADFVSEASVTAGTDDFELAGAISLHNTFGSFLSDGDTTEYAASMINDDGDLLEWETGIGTYDETTNRLLRTLVTRSSNGDAKVSFSAGTKKIECAPIASEILTRSSGLAVDAPQALTPQQKAQGLSNISGAGAEGDIFFRDGNGALARLAAGTPGQVLRQNAAGTAPLWAGGWEMIATDSPNNVATVDFTGLSAYRALRITGRLQPQSDGTPLNIRTSDDDSTWNSGAANYEYVYGFSVSNATNQAGNTTTAIQITQSVGNDGQEATSFTINLVEWNQARNTLAHWNVNGRSGAGTLYSLHGSGARLSATAQTGLRLFFASGNIASGWIAVEGLRG